MRTACYGPNFTSLYFFHLQRDMVPGVENVNIEKNILTATVKNGNLSGWDLCMKVEASTTGEVEDYKSLNGKDRSLSNGPRQR